MQWAPTQRRINYLIRNFRQPRELLINIRQFAYSDFYSQSVAFLLLRMMRAIRVIGLFLTLLACCAGFSQIVIKNTKAQGCIDGVCGDVCAYDGVEIFPGNGHSQVGKCRMLRCVNNFDVLILPCPFDSKRLWSLRCDKGWVTVFVFNQFSVTGMNEQANVDYSKPYPECCGDMIERKFWNCHW